MEKWVSCHWVLLFFSDSGPVAPEIMKYISSKLVLFVLLLYVPSQQPWLLLDSQFT